MKKLIHAIYCENRGSFKLGRHIGRGLKKMILGGIFQYFLKIGYCFIWHEWTCYVMVSLSEDPVLSAKTLGSSLPKPTDKTQTWKISKFSSRRANFRLGYPVYRMSFWISPLTYRMGFSLSLSMFFTLRKFLLKFSVIHLSSCWAEGNLPLSLILHGPFRPMLQHGLW